MFVKSKKTVKDINFLASSNYQNFTYQADKSYKAGEIYPANDGTAIGVVFNPVNVDTETGPQPVAVLVGGYVLIERLPVLPTDEAIKALKNVSFLDANKKTKHPVEPTKSNKPSETAKAVEQDK
ncbi:hypothetical protein M222_0737 [Enterococcus faecalis AZ19]|uniref:hypothetical protein n=1 Tax=Enterococcus faecalis TaxID=1351 RepID=UPI00045979C7|nr:hypothetical protein [Enterococcus faecalis]KAJ76034.1 hypothetical protein M222_0737 [Enterococcus faecalis AZ19]